MMVPLVTATVIDDLVSFLSLRLFMCVQCQRPLKLQLNLPPQSPLPPSHLLKKVSEKPNTLLLCFMLFLQRCKKSSLCRKTQYARAATQIIDSLHQRVLPTFAVLMLCEVAVTVYFHITNKARLFRELLNYPLVFFWAAIMFYFYCTVAIGAFKYDYRLWDYDLGKACPHTDSCSALKFKAIHHFTNDFKACWFTFKRANLLSHLYSKLWTVFIFKTSSVKQEEI